MVVLALAGAAVDEFVGTVAGVVEAGASGGHVISIPMLVLKSATVEIAMIQNNS